MSYREELLEKEKLKETQGYKAAVELCNSVNSFSFKADDFAKMLLDEHNTIQQKMFGAMLTFIHKMATEDTYVDGRNEYTKKTCDEIHKYFEDKYGKDYPYYNTPFI